MHLREGNLEQISLMYLSPDLFICNMRPWYPHHSVAENVKWLPVPQTLVSCLVHSSYTWWTKKLNTLWRVGSLDMKTLANGGGNMHQLLRNISKALIRLGCKPMPNPGTPDMLGPSDLLKLWFFSNKIWYICQKNASEHYPISLWNWYFLWVCHKAVAWQVAADFFFYCRCLLQRSSFPHLLPLSLRIYHRIFWWLPCLNLAITAPNLDANIVFFVKSTSHAHMVS